MEIKADTHIRTEGKCSREMLLNDYNDTKLKVDEFILMVTKMTHLVVIMKSVKGTSVNDPHFIYKILFFLNLKQYYDKTLSRVGMVSFFLPLCTK